MKKIFYISNAFPYWNDNYGIFCKKIYDIIERSDCLKISLSEFIKGKSFNKVKNIFRYARMIAAIYIKSIFFNKYDYVYIHYVWMHAFFMFFLFPLYKIINKKIIINFHGEDLTEYHSLFWLFKIVFIEICNYANLIIVPSEYFKLELLFLYKCDDKIFVSPSGGVDTDIFNKNTRPLPRNNVIQIVYCSRFDENKGWDDFIDALYILKKLAIPCKALMIGYGHQLDNAKKIIHEKKLDKIILLLGNISQKKVQEIYSSSDVFVFPTRRLAESLGLVALEAMSCGLPVIGTEKGALKEYLLDGYNGLVFEAGNYYSLASKIQYYLGLPNETKRFLSDNAYATSKKYFDTIISKDLVNAIVKVGQ
jgi:glycosyltransferase involved in cell wall biosynthesis